jgi:unconventional prefoldin RPB5 interactor 1
MKEKKGTKKKELLINKMLEAKRIELENKKKMFIYKIKNIFSKPKKTEEEKINELKKSLEKKEAEELEYMIAGKEGSLRLLEKRVKNKEQKEKIKELIKLAKKIKKGEGEREKIGREIGLRKKEVKELEKEIEKKVKKTAGKKQKSVFTEKEKKGRKKIGKRKTRLIGKVKKKTEKKGKKQKKGIKAETEQKEIKFTSPEKEMKQKKETEIDKKRKKAMEAFHQEFTSGKQTYVSIKGGAQIIAGSQLAGKTDEPVHKTGSGTAEKTREGKITEELEFDIKKTKEKIKNLKAAFFHRQINEEDYKKKLFEYQEELQSLEMEKKRPTAKSYSSYNAPKKAVPIETGLKTVQEESIEFATKHTPQSRQKVQQALKQFKQEFTTEPQINKMTRTPGVQEAAHVRPEKPTGIIKRIAPKTSEQKVMEMEEKLQQVIRKNRLSESQIRREFEFVSSKDLMKKFDKILSGIEKKYAQEETKTIEDSALKEAAHVTTFVKKKKKMEGKVKEIHEKKIITDFDKLLQLVKQKGKVKEKDAAKTLGLTPERIKECYTVLEKNELIRIEYPLIGGVRIVSKDYVEPKKEKNNKKKKKSD